MQITERVSSLVRPDAHILVPGKIDGTIVTPRLDKFIRTHEKVVWSFGQIDYGAIQEGRLSDVEINAVLGTMLVESHNPRFTARLMDYNALDHETTGFLAYWTLEEAKHYMALRTYAEVLARRGRIDSNRLEGILQQTRAGEWGEKETAMTPVQTYLYTTLQEFATNAVYKSFAKRTQEPVLQGMLTLLAKDEMRHCIYYLEKGREIMQQDKPSLDEIEDVLLNFEMPGRGFVPDYDTYERAIVEVAAPGKTETAGAVGKVREFVGSANALKLLTRPALIRRLTGWASAEAA